MLRLTVLLEDMVVPNQALTVWLMSYGFDAIYLF